MGGSEWVIWEETWLTWEYWLLFSFNTLPLAPVPSLLPENSVLFCPLPPYFFRFFSSSLILQPLRVLLSYSSSFISFISVQRSFFSHPHLFIFLSLFLLVSPFLYISSSLVLFSPPSCLLLSQDGVFIASSSSHVGASWVHHLLTQAPVFFMLCMRLSAEPW